MSSHVASHAIAANRLSIIVIVKQILYVGFKVSFKSLDGRALFVERIRFYFNAMIATCAATGLERSQTCLRI